MKEYQELQESLVTFEDHQQSMEQPPAIQRVEKAKKEEIVMMSGDGDGDGGDDVEKLKRLNLQLELERAQYRHKFFLATCLAIKLSFGWMTSQVNISSGELWEKAEASHVPEGKWDDWIISQLKPQQNNKAM